TRNGFFSVSFSSQWLPLALDSKLGVTSMQSHCFLMAGHRVIKYMFSYYISLLYSTFFFTTVYIIFIFTRSKKSYLL
ncbi:mCG145110, partial [Mus musculus]